MKTTAQTAGITFAVDDVKPAQELLPECKTHQGVMRILQGELTSCSDFSGDVVKDIDYQPLLASVFLAFSQHRPLVLTPDAVWLTIAQGVAHHMAIHGERLRSRFVSHTGKLRLVFEARGWVERSPENPWPEAFESWSGQIRGHVGAQIHDLLVCDFGTSGPVERAASQVVMMDIFERYFHYVLLCICGIPSVTLEGTTADWERLRDKARGLSIFELDWWLEHLLPICDQFVAASRGEVDLKHWQAICKLQTDYGGEVINGWVAKLFPYLREFVNGPCRRRNPIFETGEGFQTFVAPPGLSRVPFVWRDALTGHERSMEAVGGLVGVTQDAETLGLRPKVGWAVRRAPKMEAMLSRLAAEHVTAAGADPSVRDARGWREETDLPEDLALFYHATNGAELFGRGDEAVYRILPMERMEPLDWGKKAGKSWHRFVTLRDGSWLAVNLDRSRQDPRAKARGEWRRNPIFCPVCHVRKKWWGRAARKPVVAESFTELLERMLESGGEEFWLNAHFKPYGDAEEYTRA
jgi:hypothetical protein